jgi:hypothetical protein
MFSDQRERIETSRAVARIGWRPAAFSNGKKSPSKTMKVRDGLSRMPATCRAPLNTDLCSDHFVAKQDEIEN